MARKACPWCDREMLALDHLRMTTGTSKLGDAPDILEMVGMRELQVLEPDLFVLVLVHMATTLLARFIRYLRPRFALFVEARRVGEYLEQALELAAQGPRNARFEMALDAADSIVF